VNLNANKYFIVILLSRLTVSFQLFLQKQGSILYNPFAEYGTFPAAKSQMRIACKVNPSDFYNLLSGHLA
jgi:hypothetical protein